MAKAQPRNNGKAESTVRQKYRKNNKNKSQIMDTSRNYWMLPVLFVIVFIPLIVKMKFYNPRMSQYPWFVDIKQDIDVFLIYKQMYIIVITVIMILIIMYKVGTNRKYIKLLPIFIPLIIYAFFAVASSVFSKYASFCYTGSFAQFESVFVLLGYCIIAYYAFLFVKSEKDLKTFIYIIIFAVLIMSFIGVMQFVGHDLFETKLGMNLISPSGSTKAMGIHLNFGKGRVYLTLFNPNYVGVYAALLIPILIIVALFIKDMKVIICSVIGIIGLIIAVIGSQSLTGFICIVVSMLFFSAFSWRYLLKRIYITLPVFVVLIIALVLLNIQTGKGLENKLNNMFHTTKTINNTTTMDAGDDQISLTYKGNKFYVRYIINENKTVTIYPYDEDSKPIEAQYDEATNVLNIMDKRFQGITIGIGSSAGEFYIVIDGKQYNFTNQTKDGTYYYINSVGRMDKIVAAPSAIFTGYESFASYRGYIWSRTIPLLKKYIILGSGPDTYTLAFPQNDYLNISNSGFSGQVITKPHCMYLQIAVQTGVVSLIAFLIFYGMYFISSFMLYMKGKFNSIYAKVGVAIFVGTVSYMIAGLTNDSSVTTAPVFWAIIGVGISINHKIKSLNKEELELEKKTKTELEKKLRRS